MAIVLTTARRRCLRRAGCHVSTLPAEDLGETLQVSDEFVPAIVARRSQTPFVSIDDLNRIDGGNRSILDKLSAKKAYNFEAKNIERRYDDL
jgi:hypothetical protein